MDNKISIIIPVYNNEAYLDKLINSIENQNYKNFEIIFVNDGSTDKSLIELKKIAKCFPNIFLINQKNSGPGIARRNGFKKSTGDLLFFVDSDDYLPDINILNEINCVFKKYNPDVMFFDREEIFTNKTEIIKFFDDYDIQPGLHNIEDMPIMKLHGGLGCKIFRKNIMTDNMFIKSNNYEDFYSTFNYLDKCKNFFYDDKILYSINHMNDNFSLTTKLNLKSLISCINIVLILYENIVSEVLKKNVLELCPNIIISYYKFILIKHMKADKNLKDKIFKIKKIINENKVIYKPGKNKFIKKIIYKLLIVIK